MEGFYEVRVTAKRFIDKERKLDFMSFTGFNKKGKKFTMKFTQDCENIPEKEGEYILVIPKGKINQDKSVKYLTYWVKEVKDYALYDGFKENTEDLDFEDADEELFG